jgi:predicted transcriptional regulator YdeE
MNKTADQLPEIKLVGITCRTSNAKIFEADPSTNPIVITIQKYMQDNLASRIQSRVNPGRTFCVFTDYESDFTGDYTYLIGEEVTSFDETPDGFEKLTIPAQDYTKFTNEPGPMPDVCIDMWQKIWKMDESDFGGKRAYIADFEIYDERSADHKNTVLDIYIGIK